MYSAALKPVSIASTAQTRKFLPITSGSYTATGNNIIRIPVNANGFVDMKNAMLKYRITTAGSNAYFRGAHSPFQRFQVLSPDGAPLETIDNYNRIVEALEALEMSRDNMEGFQNLISGSSANNQGVVVSYSAARSWLATVGGVATTAFVTTAATAAGVTAQMGDYRFTLTTPSDTVPAFTVSYFDESATFVLGTASNAFLGSHRFAATATNTEFFIDDVNIGAAGADVVLQESPKNHSTVNTSEYLASGAIRTYAHNPLSTLTKLDVLYPAFAVGGGGAVLELTLDANNCVLTGSHSGDTPTYTIDAVELVVPVIQYPESVVQSFKQMVNSVGAVSMSSTSLQNYVYPYTGTPNSLSIPIAVRNRSLKAIYFFFQENQTQTSVSRLARDCPTNMNYYLRIGSQYFPAQQIAFGRTAAATNGINFAEAVIELGKSVSKLNDIRHGSILNRKNFAASAANGGQSIFGIDLEASAVSFLENGINTADNALSCYLEINGLSGLVAGDVQIYALFDNTISVMANGNLLVTK
jgi:hypothetical protein